MRELRAPLHDGSRGIAVPLIPGEVRHDIGALDSYFRAFAAFALAEIPDGKVFLTTGHPRITVSELTGLGTFRPLSNGKLTLPPR